MPPQPVNFQPTGTQQKREECREHSREEQARSNIPGKFGLRTYPELGARRFRSCVLPARHHEASVWQGTRVRPSGVPARHRAEARRGGKAGRDDGRPELTDGFHLVIDALKLNGIDTIYGVPGIPITDLGRLAQAEGMRVISFRHEQNAGNAAAIAGYLTKKPGICLTVSAPGFLNGLTALANATTNCFPMILISGSSEREIVDLQQGDYEEMDQLAIAKPLCKAAFRVLHAADIGIGVARAIRAAVSGRPGGVYLDLPAKLFSQTMAAAPAPSRWSRSSTQRPRRFRARTPSSARSMCWTSAKRPLIILGKGAAYAQADDEIRTLIEKSGIPFLPMSMAKGLLPDTHPQCAGAARSTVLKDSDVVMLIGARLNWLLSHGKGKTWGDAPKKFIQVDIEPKEMDSNIEIAAPLVGDIGSVVAALLEGMGGNWQAPPAEWTSAIETKKDDNIAKMAPKLMKNTSPMDFHSRARRAPHRHQGTARRHPRQRRRQHARSRPRRHRHVSAEEASRRRHLGRHGHRHGLRRRRGRRDRQAGARARRRQRLRLLRHGGRDHLPVRPAGLHRHLQQQRHLPRHRHRSRRAAIPAPPSSSRARATTR